MDQAKNFAKGTLAAGIDNVDTSLTVNAGEGARFPTPPFNAVVWGVTDYPDPADDPGVEVVRVTAIATDTLTITRGQEGTSGAEHNALGKTYQIIAPLTAKVINDLSTAFQFNLDNNTALISFAGSGLAAEGDTGLTTIGDTSESFNSTLVRVDDDNQRVTITRQVIMPNLPTTNPAIAGALWVDSGVLKVSAG